MELPVRLAALHPLLHWAPGGNGYTHQLQIDCPKCGPRYRLILNCSESVAPGTAPGIWRITLPGAPGGDGWDGVTLAPSVNNSNHGPRKACGQHFSIINGEVVP